MQTVTIERNFADWRTQARRHLILETPPEDLFWDDGTESRGLFGFSKVDQQELPDRTVQLPKAFVELAGCVACHSDPVRWDLLYRIAFRIAIRKERHLLNLETDDDVRRARELAKSVRRDRHKMKAFVRLRLTGKSETTGREQFVAWFEPDHYIMELTAPFFKSRFTSMDWSILTPDQCAHWDGKKLTFTPGISRKEAPKNEDALDDLWRSYYAHIFNPARLKLKAMQAEMPKKYWKNLPEATLIAELTQKAALRTTGMIDLGVNDGRQHVQEKIPKGIPVFEERPMVEPIEVLRGAVELSLDEIAKLGSACQACGICEQATQPVFGEGPRDAKIMIIGEQPGDQEDIAKRPFMGPAGQLLDAALTGAGLDRSDLFLTNAVKGFKWKPASQGRKRRIHDTANRGEVSQCKPWLLAEILKVQPQTIVLLGATAAKSLLGNDFQLTKNRGLVEDAFVAERVIATVHPSYLLRIPDKARKEEEFSQFIADLNLVCAVAV